MDPANGARSLMIGSPKLDRAGLVCADNSDGSASLAYLDIIQSLRQETELPIAALQRQGGEYSRWCKAAAERAADR